MSPIKDRVRGRKVLVVEDELVLALDTEALLKAMGCEVLGPVGSATQAMALLYETTPDLALLDVNLGAETSARVARALQDLNVPFVLVTAYGPEHFIDPVLWDAPRLSKPCRSGDLEAAVLQLCA